MPPGVEFAPGTETLARRGYGTRPIMVASTIEARRAMKRELYAEVSARTISALEAGSAPWSASWAAAPRNAVNSSGQRAHCEPLHDINPRTGVTFEVFYADRSLETFGRGGAGWFWWSRRRGFAPDGLASGPFATSYAAYRHAMSAPADCGSAYAFATFGPAKNKAPRLQWGCNGPRARNIRLTLSCVCKAISII